MDSNLSSLPSVRDTIAQYNLRAEKKLGQNFILDSNITDKIARAAGDISHCHVIEIGPGPGGLTRSILNQNPLSLTSIEYDDRAVEALQPLCHAAGSRFSLIKGDALDVDLTNITAAPRVVIANLPYNISTVLLLRWLEDFHKNPKSYDRLILMFQREVAMRLVAPPNTKDYGRLSVMTQWLSHARILFDVPPSVFVPPPKVISSIVEITPRLDRTDVIPFQAMEQLLQSGFGQRRKMIRTSMSGYKDAFTALSIDETLRAENLSVSEFIQIALKAVQS